MDEDSALAEEDASVDEVAHDEEEGVAVSLAVDFDLSSDCFEGGTSTKK